jgi:hypothetical protein
VIKIKTEDMGRICRETTNLYKIWLENLKERDRSEDLRANERRMLK